MKWTRSKTASALAVGAASALLLSACSTAEEPEETTTADETTEETTDAVTEADISFAYWGDFGVEDLAAEYEEANPGITIELQAGDYNAAHDNLQQALIAGSGAATIAAVDEGYMARFVAQQDSFVNLLDLGAGAYQDNYLDWKWAQAASADGSYVIGVGSDIGGMALCYRRDLFEAAGLPSDRDEVAAAMGDTWEGFIEFGLDYQAASGDGAFFVDNATNILNPVLTQNETAYYNRSNELDMNEAVEASFTTATDIIEAGLSANIAPWSDEWNTGFANGSFAVLACPAWMLGHIQGQAPDTAGNWDITDLPGPGGNWGGSFYTIPKQGSEDDQRAAWDFIEWLIQADQQIAIFQNVGNLPSQDVLYSDPGILEYTNEFFNNAPVGEIFTASAADIPGAIYYAPKNADIRTATENVLNEVQAGNVSLAEAWDTAVAAAAAADAAA